MPADPTSSDPLFELVAQWDDLRRQGREVAPEELCPGDPDLAGQLRQRIARLRQAEDRLNGRPPADPSPADDPPPGYAIEGELGRGGMGVVYKARQDPLNRTVALKMVARVRADRAVLVRFLAEAEAAASVRHPHVVQVYDYGEHADRPFLAMEHLSGGTLAGRLKDRGRLTPREAAGLVEQVARGVQAVHDQGVVHRDLKPGNVLFDADGTPKVADFGLARKGAGNDLTETRAVMGTVPYMAPEQAGGGTKYVGPAADVWSLGVVLYECLTGKRPFTAADDLSLLRRIAEDLPEPPRRQEPAVPRDLELICLKCLEKSPADRYPSAGALADDLGRFLRHEPVSVRESGPVERTVKWARRRPWQAGLLATLVVATGVSAGLTGWALVEANGRAKEAEGRAEAERNRAMDEQLRQVVDAKTALSQGALGKGIGIYDRAVHNGLQPTPDLRLKLIDALIGVGNRDRAERELAALETADLTAEQRAVARVRRAELNLGERTDRVLELLREVDEEALPPAEAAYARGLRAGSTAEAIDHLRKAVLLDPRHLEARATLTVLLLLTARFGEAEVIAQQTRLAFPDHANNGIVLAILLALRGDAEQAVRVWQSVSANFPASSQALVGEALPLVAELRTVLQGEFEAGVTGTDNLAGGFRARVLVAQFIGLLKKAGLPDGGAAIDRLPVPPGVRDSLRPFLTAMGSLIGGPSPFDLGRATDDQVRAARDRVRGHPEGLYKVRFALALQDRAMAFQGAPNYSKDRARALFAEAGAAWADAAATPGFIDVRATALEGAAMLYSVAGKPKWDPDRPNPDWLAASGKAVRDRFRLAAPISLAWVEAMVKVAGTAGDYNLARQILDDWQARAPADPRVAVQRAILEDKAGNPTAAIWAATKALWKNPKDAEMARIRQDSLMRLAAFAPPAG